MINDEIGSEFWDVLLAEQRNTLFNENISWYLSGRAALNAVIKDIKKNKKVETAALPSWCCDSMIAPFLNNGITVRFYSVCYEKGVLTQKTDEAKEADIVLLMDYFGYIRSCETPNNAVIIRDLTHSVLCENKNDADYYFGSMRKWAGFYTGGFAYRGDGKGIETFKTSGDEGYIKIRKTAMAEKKEYINGKSSSKDFLTRFAQAEEYLDSNLDGAAYENDIKNALFLDVDFIKAKRRENAKLLLENLASLAVFKEIGDNDCPLFVPLYIENGKRDGLKKYLIDKKIYCPVHWPISLLHNLNSYTEKIYENEISIICDQRYNEEDMRRIVREIKNYL